MNNLEFQLRGVGDPRLAVHATSALPAWLWSVDGTRVLWANPAGARLFGAANSVALAKKTFGPADAQRRQVAQLANRLPPSGAIRLERLRGFGAALGTLITCGCAKLDFADGSRGILVAVAEPVGRAAMPLVERLQRLVEGIDAPIAAFTREGRFIGASDAARLLPGFRDLADAGLDESCVGKARSNAIKHGYAELPPGFGRLVLQRVGIGADAGLVALMATGMAPAMEPIAPNNKRPAMPNQAPAAFALFDEFADPPAEAAEITPVEPESQPAPEYKQPAMSGEAPAEFALIDEFTSPPAETSDATPIELESRPAPDYEQPAMSGEAPAEFALIDTPAEQPAEPAVETSSAEATPEMPVPGIEEPAHEPSPYVEAVADEPEAAMPPVEESSVSANEATAPADDACVSTTATLLPVETPAWLEESPPSPRLHPLRFLWQMDAHGRFSLSAGEFTGLIGARTAARFGRSWSSIAETFGLDPDGRVLKAFATHNTWSGITLDWPVDGGSLPVELAGLPVFDRAHNFAGYRGFGVCRDLDGLTRLAALRRYESLHNPPAPQALSADIVTADLAEEDYELNAGVASSGPIELSAPIASETSPPTPLETAVEPPQNVVPFRPISEPKSPALTPVENSAFNELARQLAERLEKAKPAMTPVAETAEAVVDQPANVEAPEVSEQPGWLTQPEPPPRGESRRDRALLDLLPMGILIYRLDRLLYANPAFLERMGYHSLHALEEAGGLDALYVEPGVSNASSTSDTGTPVTISATQDSPEHAPPSTTEARLHTIAWDGASALALIFSPAPAPSSDTVVAATEVIAEPVADPEPSPVGHANAEELAAILDTTAEGILMFDAEGNINSCNRSAEALFGHDGTELVQHKFDELFAPESQSAVRDYLESIKGANIASLLEQGRDVLARVRGGGLIPVSMTMGRTQAQGPNFFAVFRDLSQTKKSESELREARRLADRGANAKADMLARISHEVRAPLNAILGFAEVMIGERFGALGNERYVEYMKDIRASGERVIAIISDLLDLSRIETGKLDLTFASQNLNDLVEQCVGVMQPQANRERIIIRTSLAHTLPPVVADARALRQITLNLIGNSIHLANAGGQVIVSTALSDFGEVVLRVRDTGPGLNDNEVAAALEPFRTSALSDQASDNSGVNLSLTKALVEANRAHFQIKTGAHSGTLIEVLFSQSVARA
ncbi:PAS domain-containing protein [Bradyrhizobium canariense]|uniref:histidine kinase n=1 Tax=Bradyrhizobium canariense TaxID=255045 RepID=A0A1H2ADT8_9BRAD|nr:PAS domain-containing protein [Bradyrhizobium canariense]SDT43999.1 PAS/PAC sensor signal transduction histidine kinase [Bradyrhizobium canariense]